MKTNKIILLPALVALLGLASSSNTRSMKTLNDFLKDQVISGQTPSVQYAFFDVDSTIHTFRYGVKNVAKAEPIEASSQYHLFSVTKTFTALAVLQLAEAGKVDLSRPASDYLPSFPYPKEITVGQLLQHTAGIPNPIPLRWAHTEAEHAGFDERGRFEALFREHNQLEFKPGTAFKYSNLGYVLLGQLIEEVSGQRFEEYISEHIVRKSGADNHQLGFTIDSNHQATGYHKYWSFSNLLLGVLIDKEKFMGKREDGWKPFEPFYNDGKAYGGMFGTIDGLIHYAQALLRTDSPLLKESSKVVLFAEGIAGNKPTGMSMSWFTGELKGNRYVAHAGGGGGYYVELRIYPDLGVGSVILYNRSGMTDERMLNKTDSYYLTHGDSPETIATR
ncbi:MAG: beta-lactamase family protein [Cyclobacteriaceae bacterium]|nr:beta-lactamase family protein [Cyclobacteriaceae bacterium]